MNNAKEQLYLAAVRSDFLTFVRHAFAYLYPGQQFMENWHHEAIIHLLEEAIQGRQSRLIINLPPRQLKSFLVSVALVAFILGMDPKAKIICVSYSGELALALAREFRRIIESDWYRMLFPETVPSKSTESEWVTTAGGFRLAVSVGGSITGRGGDIVLVDDPIMAKDAASDRIRTSTNEWFSHTLLSRLDDKSRSVLVVVMQRLHINDLTGYLEAGGGFTKLSLPAIAELDESIQVGTARFHERLAGTALHEERESLAILESIRLQMGSANFNSQYQQHPEQVDGAIFRRNWFRILADMPAGAETGRWFITIDTALSTSDSADYSVLTEVCLFQGVFIVTHVERGHWTYEELKARAHAYLKRHGPDLHFVIEYAGVGISLHQWLCKERRHSFSFTPKEGKAMRAARVVPFFEEGRVAVLNRVDHNAWVEPWLNEFMNFPFGRYDDQVDSFCQLLGWAMKRYHPDSRAWFV